MSISTLPETGFVRLPVVLSVFPVSKSVFYDGIRLKVYPAPVKLTERTSAWRVEDIRHLCDHAEEYRKRLKAECAKRNALKQQAT